jgi:hypothetical protein
MKKIGLLLTLFAMALGTSAMADEAVTTCPEGQVFSTEVNECIPAPVDVPDDGGDAIDGDQLDNGE